MMPRKTMFVALLAAVLATPALADKDGHSGKGHGGKHGKGHDKDRVVEVHHDDHRGHKHAGRDCPPGLAKKNNGCLPPGHAKRVVVGQVLPSGAVFVIPRPVLATLPPPPPGHRYAVIDNQVVLVKRSNLVVVEILRSLLG